MLSARASEIAVTADEREACRLASLHLLAAELRREAGAWHLSAENYDALARHYLARRDLKPALAFARKLTFVTERIPSTPERMNACLLAASVHLAFHQAAPANASASEAAHIAARRSDADGLERVADAFRRIRELAGLDPVASLNARCACGGQEAYIECCGVVADEIPAEFQVQVDAGDLDPVSHRTAPWLSPGRSGIDVAMADPGTAGECLNWVAVQVEGGRQSLVMLPNWSGRAMRAARTMLAVSRADPEGTDGPASTVLQVACALEAFINSIIYFVSKSDRTRWEEGSLPPYALKPPSRHRHEQLSKRWEAMGLALLGPEWAGQARLEHMRAFMQLRNALVHFNGRDEERVVPAQIVEHEMLAKFRCLVPFRDPPRPWIDRLLTPELAEWAIVLGEELIASFRKAWNERQRVIERENFLGGLREEQDEP